MSGTDTPVQVCHIIPFSQSKDDEKYNVNNGIVLRDDIHTLFDKRLIKINPYTLCVEVSGSIMKSNKCHEYHKYNGIHVKIHKNSIYYLKKIYDKM